MSKGSKSRSFALYAFLALLIASFPALLTAQIPQPPEKSTDKPAAQPLAKPTIPPLERRVGRTTLAVARDVRLSLGNRTTGRITVHGWDQDVIEARAFSERGDEVLILGQKDEEGGKRIFLKADYVNLENSASPTEALDMPPSNNDSPIQIHLEVSVPHYAELEVVKVIRSNVEITGVETPITVIGNSSNVVLKDVGSVEIHTRAGSVAIENARGIAEVTSTTGGIKMINSRGALQAVSIAGPIEVRCFKGRIEVSNTQAPIELEGIDGDVSAIAATSSVRFRGELSDDSRYYLKSMSGSVEMMVPANTRGFNATLSCYRGVVESDFSLKPKPGAQEGGPGSRLSGRFGKGNSQITLDSFEGFVKLSKVPPSSISSCK
jgi:hypothetical protein